MQKTRQGRGSWPPVNLGSDEPTCEIALRPDAWVVRHQLPPFNLILYSRTRQLRCILPRPSAWLGSKPKISPKVLSPRLPAPRPNPIDDTTDTQFTHHRSSLFTRHAEDCTLNSTRRSTHIHSANTMSTSDSVGTFSAHRPYLTQPTARTRSTLSHSLSHSP